MLNNRTMHGNRSMARGGCGYLGNGRENAYVNRSGRCGNNNNTCRHTRGNKKNDGMNDSADYGRNGYNRFGCGCTGHEHDAQVQHYHASMSTHNGTSCPLCARTGMSGAGKYDNETIEHHGSCNPEGMTNCEKLLDQIRAVDFALVEVVLYLDAYPDCHEALDTYHKLIARRKGLYAQYESSCGPLTAMGNKSTMSWDWIDKPFPWEYKAN